MTSRYGAVSAWSSFKCLPEELRLDSTLRCGQSFRWKTSEDDQGHYTYTMSFADRVIALRQDSTQIYHRTFWPEAESIKALNGEEKPKTADKEWHASEALLKRYLSLDINLCELYRAWTKADKNFERRAGGGQGRFAGIRMLAQDPFENLVCFICSSNNNIKRITQMVDNLCRHFGQYLLTLEETEFFAFPNPHALASANVEKQLRDLGFGYRAKYIQRTAAKLVERYGAPGQVEDYLSSLHASRGTSYSDAKEALMLLDGVGPKVADCILLMSLGHHGSIPVDTHLWQIAVRDYGFRSKGYGKGSGSITPALYNAVGDRFREIFGPFAGWAHSVLFCADLTQFRDYEAVKLPVTPSKGHHPGSEDELKPTVGPQHHPSLDPDEVLPLEIGATSAVAEPLTSPTQHPASKRRRRGIRRET